MYKSIIALVILVSLSIATLFFCSAGGMASVKTEDNEKINQYGLFNVCKCASPSNEECNFANLNMIDGFDKNRKTVTGLLVSGFVLLCIALLGSGILGRRTYSDVSTSVKNIIAACVIIGGILTLSGSIIALTSPFASSQVIEVDNGPPLRSAPNGVFGRSWQLAVYRS